MEKGTEEKVGRSTVLDQLPHEKWVELTKAVENHVAAPRTIIFKQGDPGDKFYIIRSGKVRVFRKDSSGLETELSLLGAGESFGEMALLTGEARSASVEAVEETHLMVLSKEQFERILKDFPGITLAFVKQVSGRLLEADGVIEKEAQQQHQASQLSWLDVVLLIGVSLILAIVFNRSNPNGIPLLPDLPDRKAIHQISATQTMEEVKKSGALLVDAGPELFYEKKHIKGAVSLPLALFDLVYSAAFAGEEKNKEVIVYGGTFSKLYDWDLAAKLLQRGHKDVRVLQGGMAAWEKMSYPVEEEKVKQ
ncbi:MAG TPA: cyclic nucleotide-binding domain-containing protein [Syntrophorhabdales bacterium]|nr:cyclic nucleotide-binding domain-containing protein [Syntrophorhabdales bacterium]